jgi:hypothetical protein
MKEGDLAAAGDEVVEVQGWMPGDRKVEKHDGAKAVRDHANWPLGQSIAGRLAHELPDVRMNLRLSALIEQDVPHEFRTGCEIMLAEKTVDDGDHCAARDRAVAPPTLGKQPGRVLEVPMGECLPEFVHELSGKAFAGDLALHVGKPAWIGQHVFHGFRRFAEATPEHRYETAVAAERDTGRAWRPHG